MINGIRRVPLQLFCLLRGVPLWKQSAELHLPTYSDTEVSSSHLAQYLSGWCVSGGLCIWSNRWSETLLPRYCCSQVLLRMVPFDFIPSTQSQLNLSFKCEDRTCKRIRYEMKLTLNNTVKLPQGYVSLLLHRARFKIPKRYKEP